MPRMNHDDRQGVLRHGFDFSYKEGGGCTRKEIMTKTKKRDLIQESYPELYYPDSVYTASTKVFLRFVEHLNAEHVFIYLYTDLVEGFESVLKNLPLKHLITCSSLAIKSCRFSFLKLLFPFVNRGCGLRIYPFKTRDDEEEAIDSAIFDSELVKTAPFLMICIECLISDEQLLCLKAYWIYIPFARSISEEGLIRLIMQWVEGKRRLNRIYLGNVLALTEDMIYKLRRFKLIPESELIKTPFFTDFMETHFRSGFRVGIRNKAGNLILVNVSEDSFEIEDPYSDYDLPFSDCCIECIIEDDDDDDDDDD
ncbi:unnamed protein product [Cylicocyclus nassatus]|uniref:Uncharacterized protein n=1 Tax=Cylicocyclus nassatus TaxID=53992 RepID=A0AA36HGA0_CYLNA|nr:unnamed protein product [Cylicocyclus nassatus]